MADSIRPIAPVMRIFISHGTDIDKPEELAFLDGLEARLAGEDGAEVKAHDVLLDRTGIGKGDDWESTLHDMLAECQAAVLLLSERALTRPWVFKEAAILTYRKARDPGFPLFLVLLPGVTQKSIQTYPMLAALNLAATQAFDSAADAPGVAHTVLTRLEALKTSRATPLDELTDALAARVTHANPGMLETLCETLLGARVKWSPVEGRTQQHARELARGIVRGRAEAVGGIAWLMTELKNAALAGEHREGVRALAAPMWIDSRISCRFWTIVHRHDAAGRVAAAFNAGSSNYISRMVAYRAMLPKTALLFFVAGGGSDVWEDELIAKVRAAYRNDIEFDVDDDELDAMLNEERDGASPLVFVLPLPVPDEALMTTLQEKYPNLFFLVHTGRDSLSATELPDNIVALEPGFDIPTERRHRRDYEDAGKLNR